MNRHERRVRGAQVAAPTPHSILAVVVSYHGICGPTVECLDAMKDHALSKGIGFAYKVIPRTPLDLARNESLTLIRTTSATAALLLDDDVQVDSDWISSAVGLLSSDMPVITAPTRLRTVTPAFNVNLTELPHLKNGQRVARTLWTGFGAVLISRPVIDQMHDHFKNLHYASYRHTGQTSCALFRSEIATNRALGNVGDPNEKVYILDDRVWSLRAQSLGIQIYATIDVNTCHDGYVGNFGVLLDSCILCGSCLSGKVFENQKLIPDGSIFKCLKCDSRDGLVNTYCPQS